MANALRGLGALLVSVILTSSVAAQSTIEQFYRGKNLTIFIGYGVGGSDDLWARVIARHIGNHIAGQPNIVPQNVPGADSLVAANQIYNTAPKDGTVIGLINRGVPFEALLGGNGVQFDPLEFGWIGSPDHDTIVGFVRADSQTYPDVLRNLLGLKIKIVSGYPGSKDMSLAVERNEVQGTFISYDTVARKSNMKIKTHAFISFGLMKLKNRA